MYDVLLWARCMRFMREAEKTAFFPQAFKSPKVAQGSQSGVAKGDIGVHCPRYHVLRDQGGVPRLKEAVSYL